MAQERAMVSATEQESLWKKSNAFKIGVGMMVVGAIFSLPVAAVGLGIVGAAWAWEKRKK